MHTFNTHTHDFDTNVCYRQSWLSFTDNNRSHGKWSSRRSLETYARCVPEIATERVKPIIWLIIDRLPVSPNNQSLLNAYIFVANEKWRWKNMKRTRPIRKNRGIPTWNLGQFGGCLFFWILAFFVSVLWLEMFYRFCWRNFHRKVENMENF